MPGKMTCNRASIAAEDWGCVTVPATECKDSTVINQAWLDPRTKSHEEGALRAITKDMSTANLKNHELQRTSEVTESGVAVIKTALCRIIDSCPNPFISSSLHLVDSIWCRFWHVACSTRNSQVRCPKLPACADSCRPTSAPYSGRLEDCSG